MLINSIKALTFKPIDFQSKKPSLLKTNYCDTFERSAICAATNPISFGMTNDELLEKINASSSKRDALRNLMGKNLDEQSASICLVLKLTRRQREQFKLIAQNYPNLSPIQAALCAKAGFITKKDDEKIEQFEAIVTHPIKYTDDDNKEKQWEIPADEAILCVKENFDESQLKRYAQLRNRVVDLRDKSVRGTGKTHNLRPQYVLDAVKEGKTDEEIKRGILFYEGITKYGLELYNVLRYITFNTETREKYAEARYKYKDCTHHEAWEYTALDEEQVKVYDKARNKGYPHNEAMGYVCSLSAKQRKICDEAINNKGLTHAEALHYARLDTEQRKAFDEAIDKGLTHNTADSYARLDTEQRKAFDEAIDKGLTYAEAFYYTRVDTEQRKSYEEAIDKGLTYAEAYFYVQLDTEQRKSYEEAIAKGLTYAEALYYAFFLIDTNQMKAYLEAINKGLTHNAADSYARLDTKQRKYYKEAIDNGLTESEAEEYAQLTAEERKVYWERKNKGFANDESLRYVSLNAKQRKTYLNLIEKNIHPYDAYAMARENITSLTPEELEQIPDNVWYKIETGENKEVHDAIQQAIKLCLNPPIVDEHRVKVRDVQDLNLHSTLNRKGILEHNNSQFAVELQKTMVEKQPVLIVKDTNSDDKFVAYKGAIAYVAPLSIIDEEKMQQEMKPHCNLLPKKQAQILTRAIQEFVVDITDSDGGCVISKGLEGIISAGTTVTPDDIKPYTGAGKTTKETEEHYLRLVEELDKQGKFNAKNMLRMFPEDAILSINPYAIKTDSSNILYSISAEWKDKEGKKWEMRIHSTDLSPASNATTADKWVFRLGYRIINIGASNERHFLRKFKDNTTGKISFDMNGKFSGLGSEESHIEFDSPLDKNNLLNNIDFQKDIRIISAALFGENELDEICTDYDILTPEELKGNRGYFDKAAAVVKYAMENPIFYYWKQEYVNKLRTILKLPDLSAI